MSGRRFLLTYFVHPLLDFFWRLGVRSGISRVSSTSLARSNEGSISSDNAQDQFDLEIVALSILLQRFPTWKRGHLELGEKSLVGDDIACSYACAQAILILTANSTNQKETFEAWFLLGRCHLRRGDPKRSLGFFEKAVKGHPRPYRVNEEMAAALMLLGNRVKAREILSAISEELLSPEGASALRFLNVKVS